MTHIPQALRQKYLFHATDISNLESVLTHGLLSPAAQKSHGLTPARIPYIHQDPNLNNPTLDGHTKEEYVTFYFSRFNPMVFGAVNSKTYDQSSTIYLCLSINKMAAPDTLFTASATNSPEFPALQSDLSRLDLLDWEAIGSTKWHFPTDPATHPQMAEALFLNRVSPTDLDFIIVFDETAKEIVETKLSVLGLNPPCPIVAATDPTRTPADCYFRKITMKGREKESIITGPIALRHDFTQSIKDIIATRHSAKRTTFAFADIEDTVSHIRACFGCLPELKGIEHLATTNAHHWQNVGDHSISVAENVRHTEYYLSADHHTRNLLELASYLHDIGKGPTGKWADGKFGIYPDHPADSIPMMRRILSEDIERLSDEDVRTLMLLVTYHDIAGETISKGRNVSEIASVVETENEIDMLFAISEADISAIKREWREGFIERKPSLKKEIMAFWPQQSPLID